MPGTLPPRVLLLLLLILGAALPAWAGGPLLLSRGEFVLDAGSLPPADDAGWRAQELPDPWLLSRPGAAGNGWYRFRLQGAELADPLMAVYLPKLIMNAAVFLNGTPIGDGGRFAEPMARNWNRPLLFLVPPGLLRPGENVLHVRLGTHDYTQATLDPFWVGPEHALRAEYERAYFLRITLNQTASLLIAAIGMLALSLWWRRRQDTAYAYFGLSALVWAAQSTNLYLNQIPFSTTLWEILVNGGFQVFAGLLLISLLRFVGLHRPRLIAALWLTLVVGPLSLWAVPARHYFATTAFWHLYTLATSLLTLVLLLRAAWSGHNRDARFLVGAMGVVVLFALHDWLIHSQHLWQGSTAWPLADVFLLHYSAPVVFLAVGLVMVGRYVQVLNEFEQFNNELEFRVQAKHAQLEQSYARMRLLEMERAVAEERERIYRDLHDDVGAKLLSLVYRASRPEDADLARSALSDLREVVSRTGSDAFGLDELVADWRSECERRLREAGIAIEWTQRLPVQDLLLSQPQALGLGRILREAVSNAIRHAGASRVGVSIACDGELLSIEVRDDGKGCPHDSTHPTGRGLRNMEARAARLGGNLSRRNGSAGGHAVKLTMPRPDAAADIGAATSPPTPGSPGTSSPPPDGSSG